MEGLPRSGQIHRREQKLAYTPVINSVKVKAVIWGGHLSVLTLCQGFYALCKGNIFLRSSNAAQAFHSTLNEARMSFLFQALPTPSLA